MGINPLQIAEIMRLGDRVKIVNLKNTGVDDKELIGMEGTIDSIEGKEIGVWFDKGFGLVFKAYNIEEIKDTV